MAPKIPPPLWAVVCALLMWLLAFTGFWRFAYSWQLPLALMIAVPAIVLFISTVITMACARTTVNPLTPEQSSSLLTRGVFVISRNPIYLADALLLLAWAIYLGSVPALAGVLLFVCLMRFQIAAEERALALLFAEDYRHYCQRVRRWL